MNKLPWVLVLAAACGSGKKGPAIDATPLQACTATPGSTISVRKLGSVSGSAVLATSPPNDGRLFVLEQQGRIRVFEQDALKPDPFLDIASGIAAGGEQGLLGLAFHPSYATNGYFYVYYTTSTADVLARYSVSATDPNKADPTSAQILLSIPDFASNHNAGMIEFGSDGYLYLSTGDGGKAGDPCRNGQATDRTASTCTCSVAANGKCEPLLGKILRLDVDHPSNGKPYGIPGDNPFASGGGEPEIFIIGLRNPWRWSFDRKTGDMWIADVGQDLYEELDVLPAGQQKAKNLGWSMYEGSSAYASNYTPDPTGKTFPQVIKTHGTDGWHAIIGGQVYRGPCYPDLAGKYFYTDNTADTLSVATFDGTNVTTSDLTRPANWPPSPSAIHADARGELYITSTNGGVFHIEAGP
jgi:glucose/arabinose dehydrogenase